METEVKKTGLKHRILHEMGEYWLNFAYLAIFFSVFTNYRRLILAHYDIIYREYGISIIKALVLAKVILILEKGFRLGRGFEDKPLIIPTLYKAFQFSLCMVLFNVVEYYIHGLIIAKGLSGAPAEMVKRFNFEWLAGILVSFAAFIPFFGMKELARVMGRGKIHDLFFRRRTQ